MIAVLLACIAAGYGLGSLLGPRIPLAVAGLFVGFVLGIAVVYIRFRGI